MGPLNKQTHTHSVFSSVYVLRLGKDKQKIGKRLVQCLMVGVVARTDRQFTLTLSTPAQLA